jgi:hypothetical protein
MCRTRGGARSGSRGRYGCSEGVTNAGGGTEAVANAWWCGRWRWRWHLRGGELHLRDALHLRVCVRGWVGVRVCDGGWRREESEFVHAQLIENAAGVCTG